MGPRHLCRGILQLDDDIRRDMQALQWGHGISAVEFYANAAILMEEVGASMGPRHLCRGIAITEAQEALRSALQWGHGISAVELMIGRSSCSWTAGCFNGATASLPWNFSYDI